MIGGASDAAADGEVERRAVGGCDGAESLAASHDLPDNGKKQDRRRRERCKSNILSSTFLLCVCFCQSLCFGGPLCVLVYSTTISESPAAVPASVRCVCLFGRQPSSTCSALFHHTRWRCGGCLLGGGPFEGRSPATLTQQPLLALTLTLARVCLPRAGSRLPVCSPSHGVPRRCSSLLLPGVESGRD